MSLARLLESLPIAILQAPMVGASSPGMALAVSEAGGLGSLAAGGLAPGDIEPAVAALKARTDAPFGVNLLMAPSARPEAGEVGRALQRLAPWYAELGPPCRPRPTTSPRISRPSSPPSCGRRRRSPPSPSASWPPGRSPPCKPPEPM